MREAGVEPWDELPLWLDLPRNPEYRGFLAVDIGRALDAGLELRPLEDTVADTLAWIRERGARAREAPGRADQAAGPRPGARAPACWTSLAPRADQVAVAVRQPRVADGPEAGLLVAVARPERELEARSRPSGRPAAAVARRRA